MNHLVGRVGSRHWSHSLPNAGVTDTFANNRNPDWDYDADGRLTDGADIQSTYDAAGETITVVSSAGNQTQTRLYDGDGRQSKLFETATQDDGSGPYQTTTTRYFVSSSVLGEVITELDETGQKRRSFVYNDGEVLAWQQKSGSYEQVSWEYRDASDASYRMATANGAIDEERSAEMDPLGSNAGTQNPYTTQGHQHWPGEDGVYPGFADLRNQDCQRNGMPFPCHGLNLDDWGSRIAGLPGFGTNWGSFAELGLWEYQQRLAQTLAAKAMARPPQLRPGTKMTPKQRAEAKRKAQKRRNQDAGKGNSEGPQKPKYPPVTASEINLVTFGADDPFWRFGGNIVDAIVDISNRQACSDAFKKYGLTIPYDVVKSGNLRVGSLMALRQPNAGERLGWTATQVNTALEQFARQQAFFPWNREYTPEGVFVGTPTVVFNATAVGMPDFGGVRTIVTHAFIHLGGKEGDPNAKPHDLGNFNPAYKEIIDACK